MPQKLVYSKHSLGSAASSTYPFILQHMPPRSGLQCAPLPCLPHRPPAANWTLLIVKRAKIVVIAHSTCIIARRRLRYRPFRNKEKFSRLEIKTKLGRRVGKVSELRKENMISLEARGKRNIFPLPHLASTRLPNTINDSSYCEAVQIQHAGAPMMAMHCDSACFKQTMKKRERTADRYINILPLV